MVKFFLNLAALCTFSSCATHTLKNLDDYKKTTNVFNYENFSEDKKAANVAVTRDDGFAGSGANLIIFLNGKTILKLSSGSVGFLNLKPGKYIFGVGSSWTNTPEPFLEYETIIEANEKAIFRYSYVPHDTTGRFSKTSTITW